MYTDRLILASASPRRVELLREAGFDFDIEPANIDESDVPPGLSPTELAIHLAVAKARAITVRHRKLGLDGFVLGADTVVAVGERLFGKAETPDEARAMLTDLAGSRQSVITGVAVIRIGDGTERVDAAESVVEMKTLSREQIDTYVDSEQWRGKAGAYGIQDHDPQDDPFVKLISGRFDNVVGLPVDLVVHLFEQHGIRRKANP